MADAWCCKLWQENQSEASEQHQTLRNIVHVKNMQSNKMNIIQHKA